MGLDDHGYVSGGHYPACTCILCARRLSERSAKENWCSRHGRPKGQDGCQECLQESRGERSPDKGRAEPVQSVIGGKATVGKGDADIDGKGKMAGAAEELLSPGRATRAVQAGVFEKRDAVRGVAEKPRGNDRMVLDYYEESAAWDELVNICNERGQSEKRMGRALKGILWKRGSV